MLSVALDERTESLLSRVPGENSQRKCYRKSLPGIFTSCLNDTVVDLLGFDGSPFPSSLCFFTGVYVLVKCNDV